MFRPTAAHRGAPVVTPASRERAKSPGLRRAAWACVFGILAVFALGGSAWAQAPESDPPAGDAPADEGGPSEPAPASPDDTPMTEAELTARIEQLAAEANELVANGEYEQSIARYLEAYRLAPAGALLYNLAYIYDKKLEDDDQAIEYYRLYLRADDAEPEIIARAIARIRELQAQQDAKRAAAAHNAGSGTGASLPPRRSGGSGMTGTQIAGWTTGGVGVAALVGGIVSGLIAQDTHNRYKVSRSLPQKKSQRDDGQTQALIADALIFTGSAAVITGLVLVLVGGSSDDAEAAALEDGWRVSAGGDRRSVVVGLEGSW